MSDPQTAYRFFVRDGERVRSYFGSLEWPLPQGSRPGEWVRHEGKVVLCVSGLHASPTVHYALRSRKGQTLGRVECRGIEVKGDGKFACREMRIVRLYEWEHIVGLTALAAAMVLDIYEREYPDDRRPREAMLVVGRYLRTGATESLNDAAHAIARTVRAVYGDARAAGVAAHAVARAVHAAGVAADVANAAVRAVYAATYAVRAVDAATYAADAAVDAVDAATYAADDIGWVDRYNRDAEKLLDLPTEKIWPFIKRRMPKLPEGAKG